jgi:hypothetical protein
MILELSDGSSALARGAAALILSLHITSGAVAILFGATALVARKGSRLHRQAGNWFVVSMLTMATIGACTSPFLPRPNWGNVVGGVFAFYLVATSWMTVRRSDGGVGRFAVGAFLVALSVTVVDVSLGLRAASSPMGSPDTPLPAYFIFGAVGAIAATGDLRLILRRGVFGAQRVMRHLWRMCVALFIAAASFFLGQPQVFPAFVRGSPWLFVPEIAVLGLMIFWLVRVRFTSGFRRDSADRTALAGGTRAPAQTPGSA